MTSIVIPAGVTVIEDGAFLDCTGLQSVYACSVTPPMMTDKSFSDYTATLYVPTGTASSYKNAEGWKLFTTISEYDTTGMKEILTGDATADRKNKRFYDLNGSIVPEPVRNGLYISNGKKIVY